MKFLTFLNYGCLEICKNMIQSAIKSGIPSSDFIVYCLDEESYENLKNQVFCVRYQTDGPKQYQNWSFDANSQFRQVVKHKWQIIKKVYETHKNLCWVDTDIVFLKDIRFLAQQNDSVLVQSDLPGSSICTGFMIFGDNESSKNLIEECAMHVDADDQLIINEIHEKHNYKILNEEFFPNGKVYYVYNKKQNALIVHNNHMIGIETKIQHFKNEGLWFI